MLNQQLTQICLNTQEGAVIQYKDDIFFLTPDLSLSYGDEVVAFNICKRNVNGRNTEKLILAEDKIF